MYESIYLHKSLYYKGFYFNVGKRKESFALHFVYNSVYNSVYTFISAGIVVYLTYQKILLLFSGVLLLHFLRAPDFFLFRKNCVTHLFSKCPTC